MNRPTPSGGKPWVAVIGPGAIGGLLAARLVQTGHSVVLIGRDARWVRSLKSTGLRVEGGLFGMGRTFRADQLHPSFNPSGPICDAVFVCVKSLDTRAAVAKARRLAGPGTAIVSLQNGLTHRPFFLRAFGRQRSVFGIAYVAGDRVSPLRIRHSGGNEFILAPHATNGRALMSAFRILKKAGWKTSIAKSEDRLLWTKAGFNAAGNPLGALTGRANGDLVKIPALKDLLFKAAREAALTASAGGHSFLYKKLEKTLAAGCRAAPGQVNSMLQDLRAGRRTEIDSIVGPFLALARKKKVPVPTLTSMHGFIQSLEKEICQ